MKKKTNIVKIIFISFLLFAVQPSFSIEETGSELEERIRDEKLSKKNKFSITPHKPVYLMPFSYNFNQSPSSNDKLSDPDEFEAKFQFSFKLNLIESFFDDHFSLQFGFTQKSFWQVYNKKASSPFRETNYEPEFFLVYNPKEISTETWSSNYILGFTHESNGQSVPLSRSWNRLYLQKLWDFKYAILSSKVWYRIPESRKADPEDSEGDDNPQIERYLGNFELLLITKIETHLLTLLFRNNLESDNRGAGEVTWSFPISKKRQLYFQYFSGYGESLIDYNNNSNRISAGIVLSDWL